MTCRTSERPLHHCSQPVPANGANLVGSVGASLPLGAIPGAGTMAGASAIGAASGLLQPSASNGEALANTAAGAILAPAALTVGRGMGAIYQGGKAALEPLF